MIGKLIGFGCSFMVVLWMVWCGVKICIIDVCVIKVFRGYVDGMQSGILDIFELFGIVEDFYKNVVFVVEMIFWVCESWFLFSIYFDFVYIGWY